MSQRKWAYKPGEINRERRIQKITAPNQNKIQKFLDLTDSYSESAEAKRVLTMHDNMETIFFAQIHDNMMETKRVDVYVWNGEEHIELPQELAKEVSRKYYDYLDSMAAAYEYLEEEESF